MVPRTSSSPPTMGMAMPSNFDNVIDPKILCVSAHRMIQMIVDTRSSDYDDYKSLNECRWDWDWARLIGILKSRGMLDMVLHDAHSERNNADSWNTLLHRLVSRQRQITEGYVSQEAMHW